MSFLKDAIQGLLGAPSKPTWNPGLCKVNARLAISRLRLQSSKKQNLSKSLSKEIAQLLRDGKEASARAQTEQLIKDERCVDAFSELEIFCEQFLARLDAINRDNFIPKDMLVCLSSIVFAAPRIEIEELKKISANLEIKFGSLWIDSCHSNLHGHVHPKIASNLSIGRITDDVIDERLMHIALENDIEWSRTVSNNASVTSLAQSLSNNPSTTKSATIMNNSPYDQHASSSVNINEKTNSQNHAESLSRSLAFSVTGSDREDELIMIEMLPNVPDNDDVTMDFVPLVYEGGVIVTHEAEDDFQMEETSTSNLEDEFVDFDSIPDGPVFELPKPAAAPQRREESHTDDALLARLNRLKDL